MWFYISLVDYKYSKVHQGFCLQSKNMAEYGSVTDQLKNKNPVKKDCKVSENPSPILSSIWNELAGKKSKGFLRFLASLKPSSSSSGLSCQFNVHTICSWFSFQPRWFTKLNTTTLLIITKKKKKKKYLISRNKKKKEKEKYLDSHNKKKST